MIGIRIVSTFDPQDHTLARTHAIMSVSECVRTTPGEITQRIDRLIESYVAGAVADLEDQGHGPALYAEVVPLGLCWVYEIYVHGQPTPATVAVHEELCGASPAQEVTNG